MPIFISAATPIFATPIFHLRAIENSGILVIYNLNILIVKFGFYTRLLENKKQNETHKKPIKYTLHQSVRYLVNDFGLIFINKDKVINVSTIIINIIKYIKNNLKITFSAVHSCRYAIVKHILPCTLEYDISKNKKQFHGEGRRYMTKPVSSVIDR